MRLKPRSTVKNPRALVYKRFISLEKSESLRFVYYTVGDGKFWTFDSTLAWSFKLEDGPNNTQVKHSLAFVEVDASNLGQDKRVAIENNTSILTYQGKYFEYTGSRWLLIDELGNDVTLLNASFNNIARYQTNKYYYVGSFDYMIKGSIEGTTTQFIKGNIIPLTSLNIKYFDDDIILAPDDLVVIDGHLYAVENPETVLKQQPRPFAVHFATLVNIL